MPVTSRVLLLFKLSFGVSYNFSLTLWEWIAVWEGPSIFDEFILFAMVLGMTPLYEMKLFVLALPVLGLELVKGVVINWSISWAGELDGSYISNNEYSFFKAFRWAVSMVALAFHAFSGAMFSSTMKSILAILHSEGLDTVKAYLTKMKMELIWPLSTTALS